MRVIAIALCCAALAGCGPFVYKIDVQQGNYVTTDVIAKVKSGQSKAEVRQILGTPLLVDVFHNDRWDYYFSNGKGGKPSDLKKFTVVFKDDKVVSFEGNAHPPGPPPVGPKPAAAPAPAPAAAAPAPAAPPPAAKAPATEPPK